MRETHVICLGDLHLTDRPKKTCLLGSDEFLCLQFQMLDEVGRYIERLGGRTVVVLPGDLVDHPTKVGVRVFGWLSTWLQRIAPHALVLSTLGQHDVVGHDVQNPEQSSFLSLIPIGLRYQADIYSVPPVWLKSVPYGHSTWEEGEEPDPFATSVVAWHVSASTEPNPTTDDIRLYSLPPAIVVCGDIHNFVHAEFLDPAFVVAAGSLLPMNAGEEEDWRERGGGFWHVRHTAQTPYDKCQAEYRKFETKIPKRLYDDTRAKLAASARVEQSVEEMLQAVRRYVEERPTSVRGLIHDISEQMSIPKGAVTELLAELTE